MRLVALAKPVFAAKWNGSVPQVRGEGLYGTALPLGLDVLLTADHVVARALAVAPEFAVGWGSPHDTYGLRAVPWTRASVAARWSEVDLAALRLPAPINDAPASWHMGMLPTLTPVAALGFPFGYDPERLAVTSRGFAGNIVGSYRHTGFPGHPHVYELSFAAPRGLSGGPLLRGESGLSRVAAGMASSSASHNPPDADVQ